MSSRRLPEDTADDGRAAAALAGHRSARHGRSGSRRPHAGQTGRCGAPPEDRTPAGKRMLTQRAFGVDSFFADLRQREFARLDANGVAYLDYAGSGLYADAQVAAHRAMLGRSVFGNPHSEHASSQASTREIDAARRLVLQAFDAADDYVVCFTANATAAIKLVAEAYPFSGETPLVLTADNHNSVNGVREFARRAGADVHYLALRDDLRLDHPEARLSAAGGGGLFAFPAQSNFSGVHHPLSLVQTAQSLGYRVLLDAAAFVPAHRLSLRTCPADFVAVSFYKMFGYPTGVGALIARRDALASLARPWFAGGTIDYASVQLLRHQLRPLHEGFEDGTANFLDIAALASGIAFRDRIGLSRLTANVMELTGELIAGLQNLRHADGSAATRIYGPGNLDRRGATVAFNALDRDGRPVPFGLVEHRASGAGVLLRGGCFCNPGAAEAAFRFDATRVAACLDAAGASFTVPSLRRCLGPDVAVGAVRASLGVATNSRDVRRALDVVASFI
jgi:selenocysteine lyase/cysteine desulfurase